MSEFIAFPKIGRFNRLVVVSEKIDGTNAQVCIGEDGTFQTGSRNRWITPESDNYGFSRWAHEHKEELMTLGPGRHFGEWWGNGIQRNYGLKEKRFSLFNTIRWCLHGSTPQPIPSNDPRNVKMQDVLPPCVGLVPVLWTGMMDDLDTISIIENLKLTGSHAAPGYLSPEGIVVFHTASQTAFKRTIDRDDAPKGTV